MSKYSAEFKIKLVKEYLEGKISYNELAIKYSIPNKETITVWVNTYESQGYDGLKVSRKDNSYSLDFKLNVVNLYLTGEMSYQGLANELKITLMSINARSVNNNRVAIITLGVEVSDTEKLNKLIKGVRKVDSVYDVHRQK